MSLKFIRDDIVRVRADAVVNAANKKLLPGGGVCGAIFKAAGYNALNDACRKIGFCPAGEAVITPGFNLRAKYIIHTVGPVWRGGLFGEKQKLKDCYKNSLALAHEYGCLTVAFPLISSGIYGYPKGAALKAAEETIAEFLEGHDDMTVYLVFYDDGAFSVGEKRKLAIVSYINDNYVEEHFLGRSFNLDASDETDFDRRGICEACVTADVPSYAAPSVRNLGDAVENLESSFSEALFDIIDNRGFKDSEVYKRANIDRRLFSKIRSNSGYQPSKNTALALCVALRLNLDETRGLLMKAGYALSRSSRFDVIIEYFIKEKIYDIFEINEALFEFHESLLGA